MRSGEFCGELFLPRLGPLAINEFKEIEADSDSLDANQTGDVFDVIDVTIHRAFFFSRAHQHGIHADHAASFTNHLNLGIANVTLDVIISPDVCVRHNWWLCRNRQNFVKPRWIDMRQINNYSEPLAFAQHVAPKAG